MPLKIDIESNIVAENMDENGWWSMMVIMWPKTAVQTDVADR